MSDETVWKGLADVRPRPGAQGFGADAVGAYVNVMVLGQDRSQCFQLVSEAMDDHDCDLLELDVESLERALHGNEAPDVWREIALELNDSQRVWCDGTFNIYLSEDEEVDA